MYATAELPMPTEWDFAQIYRDHHRRVLNLCAYLLNSREVARDASHEVFLRVQSKIGTYDSSLPLANWILNWIGAAFFMGLLLFWIYPAISRVSLSTVRNLLTSGGIGFLAAVATPVAAIILAITILGLPIGLVTLVVYLLGLYLAKIVVAKALGDAIGAGRGNGALSAALAFLAGLVIIIIAINLPYIGGVLNILLILIGLGSLVTTLYQTWKVRRNAAAA